MKGWVSVVVGASLVTCVGCGGVTRSVNSEAADAAAAQDGGPPDRGPGPVDASTERLIRDAGPADGPPAACEPPPPVQLVAPTPLVSTPYAVVLWSHSQLGLFWNQGIANTGCYSALWWLRQGASVPSTLALPCAELIAAGPNAVYLNVDQSETTDVFGEADGGLTKLGSLGSPGELTFVAGQLVFVRSFGGAPQVVSEPLPFGTPRALYTFPAGGTGTIVLASDGARLFANVSQCYACPAELSEIAMPSGTKRRIATIDQGYFVTGGGYAYQVQTDSSFSTVWIEQVDLATGTKTVAVPASFGHVSTWAADADYVYLVDDQGSIYRRRHCGGAPQLIAGHVHADFFQQDAQYLYWWNGSAIVRLPKPP